MGRAVREALYRERIFDCQTPFVEKCIFFAFNVWIEAPTPQKPSKTKVFSPVTILPEAVYDIII